MRLAHVAVTLDSQRQVGGAIARSLAGVHYLTRTLEGSDGSAFQMPLCWDALQQPPDDDLWWLSVDHGAIDLSTTLGTYDRELVTCADCIEWLRS